MNDNEFDPIQRELDKHAMRLWQAELASEKADTPTLTSADVLNIALKILEEKDMKLFTDIYLSGLTVPEVLLNEGNINSKQACDRLYHRLHAIIKRIKKEAMKLEAERRFQRLKERAKELREEQNG